MCFCKGCERELALCDWDGESDFCDSCQAENEAIEWIDSTAAEVKAAAARHGWEIESVSHSKETKSRYFRLSRRGRELKVRVSDHSTAYCSEDVSLAFDGGPDDHTIEQLEAILGN